MKKRPLLRPSDRPGGPAPRRLVARRGDLPDLPAQLPGQQRRRRRRPARDHPPAGLCRAAGRRRDLDLAVLQEPDEGFRLRRRRLLRRRPAVRHARRLRRAAGRGAPAGPEGDDGLRPEPHQRPASLVRGEPAEPRQPEGRLVRLGRRQAGRHARPTTGWRCSAAAPGNGSRAAASTTCTISSKSSRTSISTTRRCRRRCWRRRGSGSSAASTASASTRSTSACTTRSLRNNPPRRRAEEPNRRLRRLAVRDAGAAYDKARPELIELFLKPLHALTERYDGKVLLGEISGDDALLRAAEYTNGGGLDMAYSFDLLSCPGTPREIRGIVERLERDLADGWACWSFSNHDVRRVTSRWGGDDPPEGLRRLVPVLLCSLRGTLCLYQGEELGLEEAELAVRADQGPVRPRLLARASRAATAAARRCRGRNPPPRPASPPAQPWLPVPESHRRRAVDQQHPDPGSVLNTTRAFLNWRRERQPLKTGQIRFLRTTGDLLAFERSNNDRLLCLFNLGGTTLRYRASRARPGCRLQQRRRRSSPAAASSCRPGASPSPTSNRDELDGRGHHAQGHQVVRAGRRHQGRRPGDRAQRVRGLRRPLGLRQVHALAPDRRARGHHLGRAPDRRRDRQRPAAGRARHLDGLPVLRALPAHDRQGQYGLRPQAGEARSQGRRGAGPERRPHPADHPPARPQAQAALRRPAPARRHRPRHRPRPASLPVRRAALQPGCRPARPDAHRDRQAAPRARRHHDLRHPRPGRGDDAGRPDRRCWTPAMSASSARRWSSTSTRTTSSSPGSSAARR